VELTDVIDWLKKLLPAKLRVPFTTGVMLLAIVGICTKFVEGFEWSEAFYVWWFSAAFSLVCAYWVVVVLVVRKTMSWPQKLSWTVVVILAVGMVLLGIFSFGRSDYRYDRAGFFVLRSWQPDKERGQGYFEWTMEPTTDVSKNTISVNMSPTEACDLSKIDGPTPVRKENVAHVPVINDASSIEHPNTLWKIKDLHQGEELSFRLFAKGADRRASSICLTPLVSLN
jgi:hypothetical protein